LGRKAVLLTGGLAALLFQVLAENLP